MFDRAIPRTPGSLARSRVPARLMSGGSRPLRQRERDSERASERKGRKNKFRMFTRNIASHTRDTLVALYIALIFIRTHRETKYLCILLSRDVPPYLSSGFVHDRPLTPRPLTPRGRRVLRFSFSTVIAEQATVPKEKENTATVYLLYRSLGDTRTRPLPGDYSA